LIALSLIILQFSFWLVRSPKLEFDLTSETARREVIIAPILLELCRLTHSKLKIEYPIADTGSSAIEWRGHPIEMR
jgi:hypothetical protein